MESAYLDTSHADGLSGTYKWMLRVDADYRYQITVCSLFLYVGFWRTLCAASNGICNGRIVFTMLYYW